MKTTAVFLLFFLAFVVGQATAATIKLDNVPISNVVRLYFAEINDQAYSLPDELIKDERRISLSINGNSAQLLATLSNILKGYGYQVEKQGHLTVITKLPEAITSTDREFFIYRPKARTARYLTDVLRTFYPGITQAAQGIPTTPPVTGDYSPTSATAQLENRTDRLLFKGTPAEIRDLRRQLAILDVPTPSIELQVYLIEHGKTSGQQSGFSALLSKLGGLSFTLGTLPAAGDLIRFSSGSIELVLSALKTDNAFSVYTSPRLLLVDGKQSKLVVGQDVPVLASTTTTDSAVVQGIEYRSSGVIMQASANILDDAIEIDSTIEVSSFAPTSTGVSDSPTLTKRSIETSTILSDGSAVIFGGLRSASENNASSGLFFLPKALRRNTQTGDETELFVLMSARRI